MATTITNVIEVRCPPAALYAYVTQPWRWHEWHPNSKWARAAVDVLTAGDHFDEEIELRPLSPLPWRMVRKVHHTVLVADPPRAWECRGETGDGWLTVRYDLEQVPTGSRFTRVLTFEPGGLSALLVPFLKGRMAAMSVVALENLKRGLESGPVDRGRGRRWH